MIRKPLQPMSTARRAKVLVITQLFADAIVVCLGSGLLYFFPDFPPLIGLVLILTGFTQALVALSLHSRAVARINGTNETAVAEDHRLS